VQCVGGGDGEVRERRLSESVCFVFQCIQYFSDILLFCRATCSHVRPQPTEMLQMKHTHTSLLPQHTHTHTYIYIYIYIYIYTLSHNSKAVSLFLLAQTCYDSKGQASLGLSCVVQIYLNLMLPLKQVVIVSVLTQSGSIGCGGRRRQNDHNSSNEI